jgi:hypothetical protein
MTKRVAALAALLVALSSTQAAASLTETQARDKARQILMGDPYGSTPDEIAGNVKDAQMLTDGNTLACGAVSKPVWQFHVVVPSPVTNPKTPIDGYLVIDATSGMFVCANLPMLD